MVNWKEIVEELKEFDRWNIIKKRAHRAHNSGVFKERDIFFWLRLGKNIGSEEYGKGNEYQRPVVNE